MTDQSRPLAEVIARAICYTGYIIAHPGDAEGAECQEHNGWDLWTREAQAVLTAIEAAGLKIVPVEPTPEMVKAAMDRHDDGTRGTMYHTIYRAMVSKAPRHTLANAPDPATERK